MIVRQAKSHADLKLITRVFLAWGSFARANMQNADEREVLKLKGRILQSQTKRRLIAKCFAAWNRKSNPNIPYAFEYHILYCL